MKIGQRLVPAKGGQAPQAETNLPLFDIEILLIPRPPSLDGYSSSIPNPPLRWEATSLFPVAQEAENRCKLSRPKADHTYVLIC